MSYLELDILSVKQPLDTFYIAKISARDLLKICYTDPIRYDSTGVLLGGQRLLDEDRAKEIGNFISGVEAAFPNSIILAANFDEKGFVCEIDDPRRWYLKSDNGINKLIIPTPEKLASIIDGQHRVYGFKYVSNQFLDMELVCSIYLDLPNPYQAYIFATINSNQKKVDRSLAYEQFGFNIEKEEPISWSPDKLAISITRKLNSDENALQNHIKIAPQIDDLLKAQFKNQWLISTSTIVDGILRLITSDPKRDKYELQKLPIEKRDRSYLPFPDKAPLRELYVNLQDLVLYKILVNYFNALEVKLFSKASGGTTIHKTIGIQALFEVLRVYIMNAKHNNLSIDQINFKQNAFETLFEPISVYDFSNEIFQYSGVGKGRILNVILITLGLKSFVDIKDEKERTLLKKFIDSKPTIIV